MAAALTIDGIGVDDGLLLEGDEFADSRFGEFQHGIHVFLGENSLFSAALDLHKLQILGHDDVEIHRSVLVLDIVEVEDGGALVDAGADGGDEFAERKFGEAAGAEESVEGDGDGHAAPGDGGRASAAVGLEDVAIDPNGALAEGFEVDDGPEGAADEALDLGGTAVEFAPGDVPGFAVEGRVGEHGILCGDPATFDFLVFHPAGDVIFDGRGADDAGVAKGNEDRPTGVGGDVGEKGNRAKLVRRASVRSTHGGSE